LDHKAPDAFRTISEVADELDLPQHVLRFWESRFREIKPMKRGGGRRYYRLDDVNLLRGIRHLLYGEGYTIRGVQRILREQGQKFVEDVWREGAPQPPHGAVDDEFDEEQVTQPEDGGESAGGLGRRLSSLLGRDLGDKDDDAGLREEPPLRGAPAPRVDPADRIDRDMIEPPLEPPAMPPMPPVPPRQAAAEPPERPEPVAAPARAALSRDDAGRLHAAMHDLGECR
jgi:DNA-binding transcriptional MerR regulator